MVAAPRFTDHELWRWDGQFIRNKATGLVLDIRKGKLRLIQETEICLYNAKPIGEAHNQLWGIRNGSTDSFGREQPGSVIYSVSNDDWVLDIHANSSGTDCKLILFPIQSLDNDFQRWNFVPEHDKAALEMAAFVNGSSSPLSDSHSAGNDVFPQGLSPAKRGSQSSVTLYTMEAFRECHQLVYLERNPRLSDKAIAMAAAYEAYRQWMQDRSTIDPMPPVEQICGSLQSASQKEANHIYDQCDQLSNHKETALNLARRLVVHLYEQVLTSC
ncbi:hypothetical protein BX666DRAFT_1860565 [Dichotomocladium elegans]|nr:hypothetical protein BX666DRAFT_1860565 [Dichotomocladium elegans]